MSHASAIRAHVSVVSRAARQRWHRLAMHSVAILLLSMLPGLSQPAARAETGDATRAPAVNDPRLWLEEMHRAFAEQRYDGVFTRFAGHELSTLRIVHMVIDGETRERLVHLNGAPRQIIRRGGEVTCIVAPDDELLALSEQIPNGPFAGAFVRDFSRVSGRYRLSVIGEDRVAGRPAVQLSIEPRDRHRYGYRLWLDQASRLLLRSELVDADGARLEFFQFTQIRIGPEVDAAALEPETAPGHPNRQLTLASARPSVTVASDVGWMPGWLPAGFARVTAARHPDAGNPRQPLARMLYSDGLADVSVFVEAGRPTREAAAQTVESRDGATIAITRPIPGDVRSSGDQHLVTVVGEVPAETARRIADHMREGTVP
jgi:sigma-E factor negative regulatory protein RseB